MTTGMESKERLEHDIEHIKRFPGGLKIKCTCGAIWSHKPNETIEEIELTMEAHRKYFNKPKIFIL